MTRDEKVAEAKRLRVEGLSLRHIGERLGTPVTTVYRWTDPDGAARERARSLAWKAENRERVIAYDRSYGREHRGRCINCGDLMGIGVAHDGLCKPCVRAATHERRMQVCEWWAEGLSCREICARLGWSLGHLTHEMSRMRRAGYDLPYRYARNRSVAA